MSTKTIREVSDLSGVSVSALRYYDDESLFGRSLEKDDRNQRIFEDGDIARLQLILFYRELGMGITEIRNIFRREHYDTSAILNEQILQLKAKAKQFENLATLAEIARDYGASILDFNLDEETIRNVVKAYRQAEKTDIERIRNMSDTEQITIATAMYDMLENLSTLRRRPGEKAKERCFEEIRNFSDLLKSILGIEKISFRSMAKGIAGGGTVSRLLEEFGGRGFSAWLADLLRDYADAQGPAEDEESADFIDDLLGMWM